MIYRIRVVLQFSGGNKMKQHLEALGLQGVTGQFLGASSEYVLQLEKQAGFRLPDDYRDFIELYGASLFTADVGFRALVASPWAVNGIESFDVFYGMSDNVRFDLQRINIRLGEIIAVRSIAL